MPTISGENKISSEVLSHTLNSAMFIEPVKKAPSLCGRKGRSWGKEALSRPALECTWAQVASLENIVVSQGLGFWGHRPLEVALHCQGGCSKPATQTQKRKLPLGPVWCDPNQEVIEPKLGSRAGLYLLVLSRPEECQDKYGWNWAGGSSRKLK